MGLGSLCLMPLQKVREERKKRDERRNRGKGKKREREEEVLGYW